ncbi:hypothetical protein K7H22_11110 [Seohaeicola saemankumensis]|uniref:hypothetical protein n=1 Tax=Seohaeicola saemankumensis TaxID=481181 RepID=UPI001E641FC6|nr:hypothetical protein [Seohaeicola saemankumensis]MCD1626540.1 hypothetical protein [Seohaeicola saemankumensis]
MATGKDGTMFPTDATQKLLGIALPILQSPMAGAGDHRLALAVAQAGGLGALPCAMLSPIKSAPKLRLSVSTATGRST